MPRMVRPRQILLLRPVRGCSSCNRHPDMSKFETANCAIGRVGETGFRRLQSLPEPPRLAVVGFPF
ncbi:hypothetical protein BBAL3_621 [Brevundimonas sp. BAL3]|nr:hypothetical protein BBAL3_621 [Brevundimonas sp. BAL3]